MSFLTLHNFLEKNLSSLIWKIEGKGRNKTDQTIYSSTPLLTYTIKIFKRQSNSDVDLYEFNLYSGSESDYSLGKAKKLFSTIDEYSKLSEIKKRANKHFVKNFKNLFKKEIKNTGDLIIYS